LNRKYGNPDKISPQFSQWKDDDVMMSLERPLTLKYIDARAFNKMQDESGVQKTVEEKSVEDFLSGL